MPGKSNAGSRIFCARRFPITNPFFRDTLKLNRLLETPEMMFRGPYLSVKLPFGPAEPGPPAFPNVLPPGFTPYRHQQAAFERLDSRSRRSTIVATGTGSGKSGSREYRDTIMNLLVDCWRALRAHPGRASQECASQRRSGRWDLNVHWQEGKPPRVRRQELRVHRRHLDVDCS